MRVGDVAAKNVACVAEVKTYATGESLSKTRVFERYGLDRNNQRAVSRMALTATYVTARVAPSYKILGCFSWAFI